MKVLTCFAVVLTAVAVQAQINNSVSSGEKATANLYQPRTTAEKIRNTNELVPLLTDSVVSLDSLGNMHNRTQVPLPMMGCYLDFTDVKVSVIGNVATGESRDDAANGNEGFNPSSDPMDAAPVAKPQKRLCSCTSRAHRRARFPLCSKRCP
jgi:hypothetical protein